MRAVRLGTIALAAWLLGGCAGWSRPGDVLPQLASFEPLAADARVRIESGIGSGVDSASLAASAVAFGEQVARLLPGAIAQVEEKHGRAFAAPVRVFLCASPGCFEQRVPRPPGLTAAIAYDNRLILAPRLFDREPHRLRPVLVHELSHLHLGQRLGHYTPSIPVWFHEGMASWVAAGGGADLATDLQARSAFAVGTGLAVDEGIEEPPGAALSSLTCSLTCSLTRSPTQSPTQSPTRAPTRAPIRLAGAVAPDSVFYRQALLFVDWLATTRPGNFAWFIGALQNAEPFHSAFAAAFGEALAIAYRRFLDELAVDRD